MAKNKIIKISVVEKSQRLDENVDYLMRLNFDDESQLLLPMRLTNTEALSFTLQENKKQRELKECWISIPKKRTAQASARQLFKLYPDIASSSTGNFYRLTEVDRKRREKIKRAKRQWKVHEMASFANGFFVARLSCTRLEKTLHEYHQYILHPSMWSDLCSNDPLQTWDVYSQHGSFISPVKISARQLKYALKEHNWHLLGELLNEVERGYDTELEAKAALEHVISKQDVKLIKRQSFGKQNSIRQVHANEDIVIDFIDEYQGANNKSWHFKAKENLDAGERFYIMEMDRNTAGKVQLRNSSVSTAFETPEQAARQLVSQEVAKYKDSYLESGSTNEESKAAWRESIEWDIDHRYFMEQLKAIWLVTDVVLKDELPIGCLAQCFYETSFYLPLNATPLTYRAIVILDGKLVDLSRQTGNSYHLRHDSKKFQLSLKSLMDTSPKQLPKDLLEILQYSRGFAHAELVKSALDKAIDYDDILHLNEGACPLNSRQQQASFIYRHNKERNKLLARIEAGNTDEKVLARYDEQLKKRQNHPEQLIKLLVEKKLLSGMNTTSKPQQSHHLNDEFNVDHRANSKIIVTENDFNTEISQSGDSNKLHLIDFKNTNSKPTITSKKSTSKRHTTREEKHQITKERKRLWARKNRAALKAEQVASGILPAKVGRKKQHENPAARQRVYTLKKKWSVLSNNAVFLVCDAHLLITNNKLCKALDVIIPLFEERSILIVQNEKQAKSLQEALPSASNINVHINSSLKPSNLLVKAAIKSNPDTAYFCGGNITTSGYSKALSLHEEGIKIALQPKLSIETFNGELLLAKQLFDNAFKGT